MESPGAGFEWLGVERAWTRTRGNRTVVIAMVDEARQLDHPLADPAVQHDPTVLADGREAAGAHAASVAPDARILPVRFAAQGTHAFDLPHAIEYAVEMGAAIINLAQAIDISAPGVQRAIQYAATRKALVVSSSARGMAMSEVAPNIIRVLPVDADCRPLAGWHAEPAGTAALLAAPGCAAPYVSGCAALLKSLNPGWGYHELKEHLLASGTAQPSLAGHCANGQLLNVADAVLGPVVHVAEPAALAWSSLNDAMLHWRLRYRSALCVNVVALYRRQGDQHWRELASGRASTLRLTVPAAVLRRSSGTLRLASREANFHVDDLELTIR